MQWHFIWDLNDKFLQTYFFHVFVVVVGRSLSNIDLCCFALSIDKLLIPGVEVPNFLLEFYLGLEFVDKSVILRIL